MSHQNFLDPALTSDGKPYGPFRFRQLVQERYLISKHCNISYEDTGKMSQSEREIILQLLTEDSRKQREALDKAKTQKR